MRAATVTIVIILVAGLLLYSGQPAWIPAAGYGQSVAIRIQSDSTPRVGQWEELGARIETGPWKRVPLLLAYGSPSIELQTSFRFCETTYSPVLRVEVGGQ